MGPWRTAEKRPGVVERQESADGVAEAFQLWSYSGLEMITPPEDHKEPHNIPKHWVLLHFFDLHSVTACTFDAFSPPHETLHLTGGAQLRGPERERSPAPAEVRGG